MFPESRGADLPYGSINSSFKYRLRGVKDADNGNPAAATFLHRPWTSNVMAALIYTTLNLDLDPDPDLGPDLDWDLDLNLSFQLCDGR